jgi:hypothetical protein
VTVAPRTVERKAPSRAVVINRPDPARTSSPAGKGLLDLQQRAGNRAISALIDATALQRAVGWPDAKGWNKAKRTIDSAHKMVRVPLSGLAQGNQAASPNPAKTDEEAGGRAIVWVHPDVVPKNPVQIIVHLHGLTSRSVDPFPGWRETSDDPKSDESDAAYDAAAKAAAAAAPPAKTGRRGTKPVPPPGYVNPLAHKVRDVERDRIGQQIEAIADPQVMAVLPQGTGLGGAAAFGKNFDPDAIVGELLPRLKTEGVLTAVPPNYSILLSAHSAGGAAVASALTAKKTGHLGGLILFDALWGQPSKDDPKKIVSGQRDALLAWIKSNCEELAVVLKDKGRTKDEKDAAIAALPGVRGYWEGGYANTYSDLQQRIDAVVGRAIPSAYAATVKHKFVITNVKTSHDRIVGGQGTTGVSSAPLQDALSHRGDFGAKTASRVVQRDDPKKSTHATVKLTWEGHLENKVQLQPVLDANPADLEADIVEGGKTVASGDTPITFDVMATPADHTFTVVPKAKAPGDYFLAKSTNKVHLTAGETTEAKVTLGFNRENERFTERTWEVAGIDVAKANDVKPATLFDTKVIGGLNALTAGKVTAANNWFTANVSAADQKAAKDSIVSLVGRVKRAQSRGTFSNHSTGTAIDINPSQESLQNWHVKKNVGRDAAAMKLFNTVVARPTMIEQAFTALFGVDSPFKNFDVWTERGRDRLLEASERFNDEFPSYLVELATDADPKATPAPTATSVMALTTKQLKALAKKAKTAKKTATATALTEVSTSWDPVRAWVGGYVITNRKKGGEYQGMLKAAFDTAQAKDKTLQSRGMLTGMISLHPALVKALTETGWSWMVDYSHDDEKDFMHFEDRDSERTLKS